MPAYPRLPVTGSSLGHLQYSLRHALLACAICAVVLQSVIGGGFPRLLIAVLGAVVIPMGTAWMISRFRPVYALLAITLMLFVSTLVAVGQVGPLPKLIHAIATCIDGKQSELDVIVVLIAWYCLLLLVGLVMGWGVSIVRARDGAYD